MKRPALFFACGVILMTAACSSSSSSNSAPVPAPPMYKAKFDTSKGVFVIEVHRDWAPNGADRFYELVKNGYYNEARFFRIVPSFVVQWGMNKDPKVNAEWRAKPISDDPVKESNRAGYVTFAATSQPNSRTTQVFINFSDNARLDGMGFAPFGRVIEGMGVVSSLNPDYGEAPQQPLIESQGNEYLQREFPKMDFIRTAVIE